MKAVPLLLLLHSSTVFLASCGHRVQIDGSHGATNDSWSRVVEHGQFSSRDTASGAVFLGRMWLSNGYPDSIRDLWSSADGVSWTRILDRTPYDAYSNLVAYNGKLWAIGNSVWSSTNGVDWIRVSHTPFRSRGSVVVHEGRMWQLGSGPVVWWSVDGAKWISATRAAPFGNRNAPAVAVFDRKLWVIGGGVRRRNKGYSNVERKGYPDLDMMNDVWCSADGATWTRVTDQAPWKGRMWSVAQAYAGRLWLMGGYDNEAYANFSDAWYTSDGVNWQELKSDPQWSARHQPTSYVFDNSLWIVAGNSWPLSNDVWRLTSKTVRTSFNWSRIVPRWPVLRAPSLLRDVSGCGNAMLRGPMRSECFAFFDTTDVNPNSKGFYSGVYDGRYVYLVPNSTGSGFSGLVTRYDTTSSFTDKRSWTVYDTAEVNPKSKGFIGGVFDGRYIYFAPFYNGETSGQVTRYDTNALFTSASSWTFYDMTAVDANSKGFQGAVSDGRYVYFVPYKKGILDQSVMHGQVTRYDTNLPFTAASSWTVYDTTAVNPNSKGFVGGVFDGRYVYFVPLHNGAGYHGQATRYDTTGAFTSAASWSVFDTTAVNVNSKGFVGGVFDGRYVYFVPYHNDEGAFGQVTRFDTTAPFASATAWRVYDTTAVDPGSKGFAGAVFDGRYIYFVPNSDGAPHGQVTRYDTSGSFTSADSWAVYDTAALKANSIGFHWGVFDGRYIYLMPQDNGAAHGLVTRIAGYVGGTDLAAKLAAISLANESSLPRGDETLAPVASTDGDQVPPGSPISVVTVPFEKTNTTLSNITGLAARVEAGKSYIFEFTGFVRPSAVGGYKLAMSCTCTPATVNYEILATDNGTNAIRVSSHHTILGGNDGNAGATNVFVRMTGAIVVESAGTLAPQFAQEVPHGTSSVVAGSKFDVREVK